MKVTFSQAIYDDTNGVNCNFEIVDAEKVTVKDFCKALYVRIEVDHPFDAQVIRKAKEAFVWGLSRTCEFHVKVVGAQKYHSFHLRQGETLSISPSEYGPGDVTKVVYKDEPKSPTPPAQPQIDITPASGDEEESEKVKGLANV